MLTTATRTVNKQKGNIGKASLAELGESVHWLRKKVRKVKAKAKSKVGGLNMHTIPDQDQH